MPSERVRIIRARREVVRARDIGGSSFISDQPTTRQRLLPRDLTGGEGNGCAFVRHCSHGGNCVTQLGRKFGSICASSMGE